MKSILLYFFLFLTLFTQQTESDEFSYSLKLYNEKFYDLSTREFRGFVKKYPNSFQRPDALYFLGKSLVEVQKPEEAIAVFRELSVDFPQHVKAAHAWVLVGDLLQSQKKWAEAATAYETVKILYASSSYVAQSLYVASEMYEFAGDLDKAEFTVRSILDQFSDSEYFVRAQIRLAYLLRMKKNYPSARQLLAQIQATKTYEADKFLEEANLEIDENQMEFALTKLQHIIKLYPNFNKMTEVNELLGEIYFRQQNYSEAIRLLSQSTSEKRFERIGDSFFLQKKYNDAIGQYQQVSGMYAKFKSFLANLHLKNFAEADAEYKRMEPGLNLLSPEIREYVSTKRLEVLRELNALIEIVQFSGQVEHTIQNPFLKATFLLILGETYEKRGEWNLALQSYNRFLFSEPSHKSSDKLYYKKARLLEIKNDVTEAKQQFEAIVKKFPNSIYFSEAKERIQQLNETHLAKKEATFERFSHLFASMIESSDKGKHFYELAKINADHLFQYETAHRYFLKAATFLNGQEKHDAEFQAALALLKHAQLISDQVTLVNVRDQLMELLQKDLAEHLHFEVSKQLISAQLELIKSDKNVHQKAIDYYSKFISVNDSLHKVDDVRLLLADQYIKEKHPEEALKIYQEITETRFKEDAIYKQAQIFESQKNNLAAIDQYKTLLAEFPQTLHRYSTLLRLEFLEDRAGNKENAMAFLQLANNEYPMLLSEENKTKLLTYYIEQGQFAQAEQLIGEKTIKQISDDLVLIKELHLVSYDKYLQLAKFYDFKGEHQKAVQYYSDYLKLAPNLAHFHDVHAAIGDIYIEENRKEAALSFYKKIPTTYSDYTRILKNMALLSFELELHSDVVTHSKTLLTNIANEDPAYSRLNLNYLISQIRLNESKNFKEAFKQYKKQFPKDEDGQALILLERAKKLRDIKSFDQSNQVLDDILDDYEKTSYADDATFYTILNYITVNRIEKAMDLFIAFRKDYPNSNLIGQLYNTIGLVYVRANKPEDAISAFKEGLNSVHSEDKKVSYANLIDTYKRIGLWESVLTYANNYIQLFPNEADAFQFKILIGQSYSHLKRGNEGVAYLKRLKLEAGSEDEPEIQYYIGEAYLNMKEFESAIAEFIKIPLLSKQTKLQWVPSALYQAGQCYERLGKPTDAVKMYTEIVKRPGIDALFKKEAQKHIDRIRNLH